MKPTYVGNADLLKLQMVAFFSSRTIASESVLPCYDWATSLDKTETCVVSGFQSPIEKDVLHFLLEKDVTVILVLGRCLYKQIPSELKTALNKKRLLIMSISFSPRQSKETATQRNKYVVDMVDHVCFGSISETSSLYSLYLYARDGGKDVVMLGNKHK
jgi:predicted Rossmann fold nucleotide-binding protein DprA/Smf involved in DNA uptake